MRLSFKTNMHLSFNTTIDQLQTTKFALPPSKAKILVPKLQLLQNQAIYSFSRVFVVILYNRILLFICVN